jgi:hypothetical protein
VVIQLGLVLTEYIADEQQWGEHHPSPREKAAQKLTNNPQSTSQPRNCTRTRPRSPAASSKPTWTGASSRRASGGTVGTRISRPNSPSGSSSTSGAATRARRCTTGPASGRPSSSCCSRARRG